jgi:chromosome segregation ATPase
MDQSHAKLKTLRDNIVGIEMKINLLELRLTSLERDIEDVDSLAHMLAENIAILKMRGIVAIAIEYKKIIKEFNTANTNLSFLKDQYRKTLDAFDTFHDKKDEALKEYNELKDKIEEGQVVLAFDPSKRKK